jgi:hypothetical protein
MVRILLFYNIQTHLKKWLEVAAISQKSGQSKANGQVIGQVRVVQINVCHLSPFRLSTLIKQNMKGFLYVVFFSNNL